jgi:hypothetical protein
VKINKQTNRIETNASAQDCYSIPDYLWVPPVTVKEFHELEAIDPETSPTTQPTIGKVPPRPVAKGSLQNFLATLKPKAPARVVFEKRANADLAADGGKEATQIPHPDSNYSHEEPDTAYFLANKETLSRSPGYLRLAALYQYLVNRLIDILHQMNTNSATAYTKARRRYLEFADDLDDHDQTKGSKPGGPGYGVAIKWFSIHPTIVKTGKAKKQSEITAVRFIVKWNPVSST